MHKHSVLKCLHIPWAKGMETIQCDLSDQSNSTQTAVAQALLLAAIFMPAEEGRCLTWLCFCCDLGTLLFLLMTQKLEKGQPALKGEMRKTQETWCSPSTPTHGLHYIRPLISTFEYGYVDGEKFSSCAGYEISPPLNWSKIIKGTMEKFYAPGSIFGQNTLTLCVTVLVSCNTGDEWHHH